MVWYEKSDADKKTLRNRPFHVVILYKLFFEMIENMLHIDMCCYLDMKLPLQDIRFGLDHTLTVWGKEKHTHTQTHKKRTHPHPLQYLDQVCIQSILSAADLLHVPLELLDQNLQLAHALVCFVCCATQRPGLDKTGIKRDLNPDTRANRIIVLQTILLCNKAGVTR